MFMLTLIYTHTSVFIYVFRYTHTQSLCSTTQLPASDFFSDSEKSSSH